jgi:hypothetical protein
MDFDRFIPEGAVFFFPASIDDFATRTEPVPSRFYSAHFAFTCGQFCIEVPHDPNYYFHGEDPDGRRLCVIIRKDEEDAAEPTAEEDEEDRAKREAGEKSRAMLGGLIGIVLEMVVFFM